MNEIKTLACSLEDTIKSSELKNIGYDLSEVALDSIMSEGLLKDLPIVGTLLNLGKTAISIRDYLFQKKIIGFLTALDDVSVADKEDVINKINNSKEFQVKIGEKLLYIIDKSQDHEKAKVIGRLFKAVVQGEITYKTFLIACSVIESITYEQLDWFVTTDVTKPPNDEEAVQLMYTGLLSYDTILTKGKRNKDGSLKRESGEGSWSELIPFVSPIGRTIKNTLSIKQKI